MARNEESRTILAELLDDKKKKKEKKEKKWEEKNMIPTWRDYTNELDHARDMHVEMG